MIHDILVPVRAPRVRHFAPGSFLLLSLIDILTTLLGFARGIPEANPMMAAINNAYGTSAMIESKLVVALVLTDVLGWCFVQSRLLFWSASAVLIVVMGVAVLANVWTLLR